jgi:recombination protein RecR
MDIPSKKLEQAVFEISKLPGIGQKTALRLALHLLRQDTSEVLKLSEALLHMKTDLKQCERCFNISDSEICEICRKPKRDEQTICVVEDIRDVMAIENAHGFTGLYHVLGGLISPMDGIGPSNLTIDALLKRIEEDEVKEVILALNTTMEGDTTNFYLFKKMSALSVNVTTIARGIGVGDSLEYTDEVTLGRSLQNRIPFEQTMRSS